MMIKKLFTRLVLTVAATLTFVACSEADDYASNNGRTTLKSADIERKFPEYEDITLEADEITTLVNGFNDAINELNSDYPATYDVKEALLTMETHFNYGVVAKMPNHSDAEPYEKMEFLMEVSISDGFINTEELKTKYLDLVNSIVNTMENKNFNITDWYVADISESEVTFGIEMNDAKLPFDYDAPYPVIKILRTPEQVSISDFVTSNWSNLNYTNTNGYNTGVVYFEKADERVIHQYSFTFVRMYQNGLQPCYLFTQGVKGQGVENFSFTPGSEVTWGATLQQGNTLESLVRLSIYKVNWLVSHSSYSNFTVINYDPTIHRKLNCNPDNIYVDKYLLETGQIKVAQIVYLDLSDMFVMNVTQRDFVLD